MSGEAKAATFRTDVDKNLNNQERFGISKGSVREIAGAVIQHLPASLLPFPSSSCRPQEPVPGPGHPEPGREELGWLCCGTSGRAEREPGEGRKALFTTGAGPGTRLCPAPGSCVFLH